MGVVETGFVIAAAVALIASLVVMAMFASTATKFTGDMIEDSRKPIKPKKVGKHIINLKCPDFINILFIFSVFFKW